MFKGLFTYDNPVFRVMLAIGKIWWLNILFILTSIPLITAGASLSALIYAAMKWREGDGNITANYFKTFKGEFKASTLIFIIYLIAGGIIALNLIFWNRIFTGNGRLPWMITLAVGTVYVMSLLYVFPIQTGFVNPIRKTIEYSIVFAIKYIHITIQMLLILGIVLYLNFTTVFAVNFISLNFGFGLLGFIFAGYYKKVFNKYIKG